MIDAEGRSVYPYPRRSHLYHEAYFGHRYFYADGEFTVIVPPGSTTIQVMRGFEYLATQESVIVEENTDVVIEIHRFLNMASSGWRSGDTHVHMNHGGIDTYDLTREDAFLMQRAEDLGLANLLDNGLNFTGQIDPISTVDHLVYFGIEYRSALWGHLDVIGVSQLTPYGCCSRGGYAHPMNIDLTNTARSYGGTVIFAHPITLSRADIGVIDQGWPSVGHGRELPIDVALGAVDAIDLLSYSNKNKAEYGVWYDLLNHGFRIPATAGTDAGVNGVSSPPMGGYRVYAQVGPGPWTLDSWLEAIRKGNSFVTNGPLIRSFRVAGAEMGSVVPMTEAQTRNVFVSLDVWSQWPIEYAQIIVNGLPRSYVYPSFTDKTRITSGVYIDAGGTSAWVALKIYGYQPNPFTIGSEIHAHSNPVYLSVAHRPVLFGGSDPTYYIDWINDMWSIALGKGFETAAARDLTEARLSEARSIIYRRTTLGATRSEDDLPPPPEDGDGDREEAGLNPAVSDAPLNVRLTAVPLPGGAGVEFRFGSSGVSPESFELYDVSGRRLASRRIDQSEASGGSWTWRSSGDPLRSGIYFAVFRRQEWSGTVRVTILP